VAPKGKISIILLRDIMDYVNDKGGKVHRMTFDQDVNEACLIKTNVYVPIDMPHIGQENFGKQSHGVWHVPKKELRHMIWPRGALGRNKSFLHLRL
jgi:hypothetical protein